MTCHPVHEEVSGNIGARNTRRSAAERTADRQAVTICVSGNDHMQQSDPKLSVEQSTKLYGLVSVFAQH